ncbi:hypothetical protein POM88_044048 [Heracleum sosnowskyi]|uniref:Uncharacterized protein n=1 Tax=Heracleum sosnowskyi TaxID=360622 RepID=A0AAD8H354_9APIA|nr:hypothetical protein POM88_044048 [Heracleum sosnowskyi]
MISGTCLPPPNIEEALMQFNNTMYTNTFVENETVRRVSVVPVSLSSTAEYMANYGMQYMAHFVEAPGIFGSLQHFLDRDMGLALPMEVLPNFGEGEVVEGSY